jgi:hypothetical protein
MRVLSIGTGLGDVITIGNTRLSIINTMKKMTTSSKKVAASLDRFNVKKGLWDITLSDCEAQYDFGAYP